MPPEDERVKYSPPPLSGAAGKRGRGAVGFHHQFLRLRSTLPEAMLVKPLRGKGNMALILAIFLAKPLRVIG